MFNAHNNHHHHWGSILDAARTICEAYGDEVNTWKQGRFYAEVAALHGRTPNSVQQHCYKNAKPKEALAPLRPQKKVMFRASI